MGSLSVELTPSDERDVRTDALIEAWRERVKPMAGLTVLSIRAPQGGPPGREIDVRLSGDDLPNLKKTAEEIGKLLKLYPGVSDVDNDLPYGKRESILKVTPEGKALGFNTGNVGLQVRHAFEGAIAKRFARGDEEVTVRVRLPRGDKDTGSLDVGYGHRRDFGVGGNLYYSGMGVRELFPAPCRYVDYSTGVRRRCFGTSGARV